MNLVMQRFGEVLVLRSGTAAPFRLGAGRRGEAVAIGRCGPHPAGRTQSFRYERPAGR